ncbi:MAG TPA: PIG-L family deacetylase [Clostridia bacterium]|nr:PIG-L family deacetylase [Clostridia bacterium]
MKLKNTSAEIYVPDNMNIGDAVKRTTHMAISAHQDDIEIMAYDGISRCFGREDLWFMAAVVTNGAGSPRNGLYADYTDERMQDIRRLEQKKAAFVGEYSALALLDYSSTEVKDPGNADVSEEIRKLVLAASPRVIYTHNLADKHDTHVATALRVIRALRLLPEEALPDKVYGCEVWRNLDWVMDNEKVAFDVSGHPNIADALVGVFDSQICGGKRYDLATHGRRTQNATYFESHGTDGADALSYAMDLTPLIRDRDLVIEDYVTGYIDRFKADVRDRLLRMK